MQIMPSFGKFSKLSLRSLMAKQGHMQGGLGLESSLELENLQKIYYLRKRD